MRKGLLTIVVLVLSAGLAQAQMVDESATPQPLVDAYDSLADTILAAKKTEWNLVHSILGGTYSHAEGVAKRAMAKLGAGQDAAGDVETLAALVAQLGNEGDASIAAVRKRLLEGGHHHNAKGEEQGVYDEGFVIVTRASRKVLLDAAKRIGRLGGSATEATLQAEWDTVRAEFRKLHADTPLGM
ncbi:MAG: hypothetical protein GTO30_13440 [Acidobacteria bacterium]|nr:hypothetical protein [Acidobacteriota bacterium]NIM62599.1 hypothetical protein [Acidobacteriota bacterium]NIO60119.1 hypothetical protein [Acidobacteriota bacterium]NIQ86871.1 hypothetical protein [Acidobacteriota bacterium]NIT12192.1 hypothetical protein [Acidobacteriota bacterium]